MGVNIKLRGGPCDGDQHDGVRENTRRITRSIRAPGAVYDITDEFDAADGRRLFVFRETTAPRTDTRHS